MVRQGAQHGMSPPLAPPAISNKDYEKVVKRKKKKFK
jgi:hypothetical protein